jgi:hypothetical protein
MKQAVFVLVKYGGDDIPEYRVHGVTNSLPKARGWQGGDEQNEVLVANLGEIDLEGLAVLDGGHR